MKWRKGGRFRLRGIRLNLRFELECIDQGERGEHVTSRHFRSWSEH